MPSLRDASRKSFTTFNDSPTHEEIRTGSFQRIADSVETIAKRYSDLLDDAAREKRQREEAEAGVSKLYRRIYALKGVITKLKKRPSVAARKATNKGTSDGS